MQSNQGDLSSTNTSLGKSYSSQPGVVTGADNSLNEANIESALTNASAKIQQAVTQFRAKLNDTQLVLRERTKAAATITDQYVHDYPWQSVAVAAGIGVIVGLLIGKR